MSFFSRLLDTITYPLRAILYSPSKLFAPLRRLGSLSLPAKVALLLFVFLVILVVVLRVMMHRTTDYPAMEAHWNEYWWVYAILVVAIPIVTYYTLKLLLEGEISPYPDIDHAWKTGLAELQRQGLDVSQIPLFLILGSAGEGQERALFHASRLNLNMEEVPHGPAALHWYANPDGVYLVCTAAGSLSSLASKAREVVGQEKVGSGPVPSRPADDPVRGTIVADADEVPSAPAPVSGSEVDVTAAPRAVPAADIRGTMQVPRDETLRVPRLGASERRVIKLDQHDIIEQDRRLAYVCRLIRRQRQPLCPINGILALLPFVLIRRSPAETNEIARAAKRDLSAILRVLMVRCPVTALVVGLEEESGFRELVRRVGQEAAARQRFGKGYSVEDPPNFQWGPATPQGLRALCAHACGSFEDWMYALFREKEALSRPGNTKLYALLVRVRRDVQGRLENILAEGFAVEGEEDQQPDWLLFGGCYFAATGEREDRQAFVKSVFEKLPDQENEVQWTKAAIRKDQKLQRIGQGIFLVCTALIVFLVAVGIYWYCFSSRE